ncbi:unnamed protein product [Cylicocyclus nassatus]|uniref:Uncharacterized protein n=1 Tax=Cylicocyclus nassatus TaxID=53992 RepID=A0AA36GNZ9_CYLNA|nr:unnamed protein product [Cylicocyclus nassatus]
MCLRACFEEDDCSFVSYRGGLCSMFTIGNATQNGGDTVYKLDYQLKQTTCRRLPLAPQVEFHLIPLPELQSQSRMMELLDKQAFVHFTVMHIFLVERFGYFFTKNTSEIPKEGEKFNYSLVFAKNPQPECVSIPVFQKATDVDWHKLYFGDIYNVTGYEFLDAYALRMHLGNVTSVEVVKSSPTFAKKTSIILNFEPKSLLIPLGLSDAKQAIFIANVLDVNNTPIMDTVGGI